MSFFFALWPDARAGLALAELAAKVAGRTGGRATPLEKIHLTLAFLGEVPPERMNDVEAAAARTKSDRFDLVVDTLGCFRHACVAWIGCSQPAPRLLALQSDLAEALHAAGFGLDDHPFTPHITLARKAARALPREPAPLAIGWRVRELALVRSEHGTGRYATIKSWKLGARKSP